MNLKILFKMPKFYYVQHSQQPSIPRNFYFEISDRVLTQLYNKPAETLSVYYHDEGNKRKVSTYYISNISLSSDDILNLLADREMCDITIKYDSDNKRLLFVLCGFGGTGYSYRNIYSQENPYPYKIPLDQQNEKDKQLHVQLTQTIQENNQYKVQLYQKDREFKAQLDQKDLHFKEQLDQKDQQCKAQLDQKNQEILQLKEQLSQFNQDSIAFHII